MNDVNDLAGILGWTESEMRAVTTLIATIAMARTLLAPDYEFTARVHRWESRSDGSGSPSHGLAVAMGAAAHPLAVSPRASAKSACRVWTSELPGEPS